ncbi:MAG: hypothetical protein ABSA58_05125 [Acetobacteraceae bacterium]|jgi:hypothetical protein
MSEETGTKGGGGPTSFVALLRYINLVTRVARTRTSHSRLRPLSACQYFTADRISEQRELIFVKSMYQADVGYEQLQAPIHSQKKPTRAILMHLAISE